MRGASGATDPFDERPTPVGLELDGSYPMRIHHVLRGGLIFLGTGIGAMSLIASAGVGTAYGSILVSSGACGGVLIAIALMGTSPSCFVPP